MLGRFLLVLLCAGCVKPMIHQATSPEARADYAALLGDDQMAQAVQELTRAIAEGTLDAMTDDQRSAKTQELARGLVDTVATQLESDLKEKIGPAIREQATTALAASLQTILVEKKGDAKAFTSEVTAATVAAFTRAAGEGLRNDLGPAAQRVIEDNLSPALMASLTAQEEPLAKLARTLTRSAADGVADSLGDGGRLGEALKAREQGLRDNLDETRGLVTQVGIVALGLLLVAGTLVAANLRLWRKNQQIVRERDDCDDALLRMAGAVKDVGHTPGGRYIAARMREKNNTRSGRRFKELLDANPALRIDPGEASAGEHHRGVG